MFRGAGRTAPRIHPEKRNTMSVVNKWYRHAFAGRGQRPRPGVSTG